MDRFYNGAMRRWASSRFRRIQPDPISHRPRRHDSQQATWPGFPGAATASSNNCPSIFGRLVAGSNPARPAKTAEWKRHFLTRDAPFLYVRSDRDPAWTLDSAGTYFFFVRTGLDCAREMREGGMNGVKME